MAFKTDIAENNIIRLKTERAHLCERLISQLSELAEALADEAGEEEIFFRDEAFIKRYITLTEPRLPSDIPEFNKKEISGSEELLSGFEKAFINLRLCEILGISGMEGAGTFFDDPPKAAGETVAAVKNHASDSAYLSFSSHMLEPRINYVGDFTQACESVYYGKSAYCLLPIASSLDGRLVGIRNIAAKYSLKTASCCKIIGENDTYTVFALLKKELSIPQGASNVYFEFAVRTDNGPSEILTAAEACGMKTDSVTFAPEYGGYSDIVLKVDKDGFCGFLSYLSLTHPEFIPIGIFDLI